MKRILSIGKDDFLSADFPVGGSNYYTESAQCGCEFSGCDHVELRGAVRYFGGIPGSQLFQYFIYGVLWHRYRSLSFVLPICR